MDIHDKDKQHATDTPAVEVVRSDEPKGDKVLTVGIIIAVVIIILSLLYWFFGIDKNGSEDEIVIEDIDVSEGLSDEVIEDLDGMINDNDNDADNTATGETAGVVAGQATGVTSGVGYTGAITGVSGTVTVYTALLANPNLFDFSNQYARGCDVLVMVPHAIAPTPRVLNTALAILFADEKDYGFPPANFIATQDNLAFYYATITNGIANVYLTGVVGPIDGVCDVPRIETQITETALQFPTVQGVRIFLNNEPLLVQ
jgi:hypothetical protein